MVLFLSVLLYLTLTGAAFDNVSDSTLKLFMFFSAASVAVGWVCLKKIKDNKWPILSFGILLAVPIVFVLVAVPYGKRSSVATAEAVAEGYTKGNLASMRSALQEYYLKNNNFPDSLSVLTGVGKPLKAIPTAKIRPFHPDSSEVYYGTAPNDSGGWFYANDPTDKVHFGDFFVNCTHKDIHGQSWSTY